MSGVGATLTALFSWRLGKKALELQDEHNKMTLKPIPAVALADYEGQLRVKFVNDGAGPFIIKSVQVCRFNEMKNDLISWMPEPPGDLYWSNFTSFFEKRAFLPNNEIILLDLQGDPDDSDFAEFRDRCRILLGKMRVILEYTDLYGKTYPKYLRELDWFERNKGTRKNKNMEEL